MLDKGVAPTAWAIVLLVPPPPQGLHSPCTRHRCEREGQSLLFLQRPPPTHRSRRAPCQMRLSDFSSVQAAHVRTGRAVSAIRSKTTAHSLVKKSSLSDAACLCRQNSNGGCCTSCLGHCSFSATASTGITQPVQAAQVWTGKAVSAIRSKTTAHSLLRRRNP